MDLRIFNVSDEAAVVSLWERCGLTRSWNDPHQDIRRKLEVQADLFLVGVIEGQVVATVMAGYEGHRGWINYLAVAPDHQGLGYGRRMMEEAERRLLALGCPKINLLVRSTNQRAMGFYQHIGYSVDEVVSFGKRIVSDDD